MDAGVTGTTVEAEAPVVGGPLTVVVVLVGTFVGDEPGVVVRAALTRVGAVMLAKSACDNRFRVAK